MSNSVVGGYAGRILRVNLSTGKTSVERPDEATIRTWIGGTGLGMKYLFEEVPAGVEWDSPENRLVFCSGPLAGTTVRGSGIFSVVTKGPMTNGATSSQANGYLGAYMKMSGFDGVIFEGQSDSWVYLHLHDGETELKDASALVGMDSWEMQAALEQELGKRISVFGVGPAGENLVRWAAIAGDRGHVAGHNGTGAVMGKKRLKAVVATRGPRVKVANERAAKDAADRMIEAVKTDPWGTINYNWGSSMFFVGYEKTAWLPVKNLTTNIFPNTEPFMGENYRKKYRIKRTPCWACSSTHLHELEITDGRYCGEVGDEPEYEQWAACGPIIGNDDPDAAMVLANDIDKLGLEANEAGWVLGWVMECYEKGILTKEECDGLEMTWGNVEAARALVRKIAHREGIGDLLAEGVKLASEKLGRGSEQLGVYTLKGNSPRGHDHRIRWTELLDTCLSDTGTIETGPPTRLDEQGLPYKWDPYDWKQVAEIIALHNGRMQFEDSIGACRFTTRTFVKYIVETMNAVTGWDMTVDEAYATGKRISHLMRVFNLEHGHTVRMEYPSTRYGSAQTDGPEAGRTAMPYWEDMRRVYYDLMGWDLETGRPLPETLKAVGLEDLIPRVWPIVSRDAS
ncbi:MAG: aldehyde ferredoxin oxidoreductase family protein [Chloroflexota bacterium]